MKRVWILLLVLLSSCLSQANEEKISELQSEIRDNQVYDPHLFYSFYLGMEKVEYQFLADSLYTVDIMQKLIPDSIEIEDVSLEGLDLDGLRYVMNWKDIEGMNADPWIIIPDWRNEKLHSLALETSPFIKMIMDAQLQDIPVRLPLRQIVSVSQEVIDENEVGFRIMKSFFDQKFGKASWQNKHNAVWFNGKKTIRLENHKAKLRVSYND